MRKNSKNQYRITLTALPTDEAAKTDFERGFLKWIIDKAVDDYSMFDLRIIKDVNDDDVIKTTFITTEEYVFNKLVFDCEYYRTVLKDSYKERYGMIKDFSIKGHVLTTY